MQPPLNKDGFHPAPVSKSADARCQTAGSVAARVAHAKWHVLAARGDVSDCWVRRSWLAHCAYVAELEAEHATIAARADQQHAWVMIGDDHGVYGAFPPAVTH